MKTIRQPSRMFFKPVNGKATPPPKPAQHTRDGWPMGKRKSPAGTWITFIEPQAYAKLMVWYRESKGLELSGYALLAEPVNAELDQDTHFHVKDLMLVCAIEESSRGYTEMSAEQRVCAMMKARAMGYKANQLGWWHHHPVTGWSGTDVNTLRQRVHELGLPEVLSTFAFVLTPNGIRARWDRSGPQEEDNVYVDEIPVIIGNPDLLKVIDEAQAEVGELLAERAQPVAKETKAIAMPTPSWQRQSAFFQSSIWDGWLECDPEEIYFYDLAYTEVATEAIANALGPNEDPYEFICRRDPETLVSTEACAACPFMASCFGLNLLELEAETQRILEGAL